MTADQDDPDLERLVARTSGVMMGDQTVATVLRLLTATAVHAVPAAWGAGITLAGPDGAPETTAATDALVAELDLLQYELDEGPCLTAWARRQTVRVDDLRTDRRWPRWAESAATTGVRASLSAPMVAGDTALGAIKLYARRPAAFSEGDEATLSLFAAQSGVLVSTARSYRDAGLMSEQLQGRLRQRDAVNRACGVLMGRDGVSEQVAFTQLMGLAQRDRRSVHAAAEALLGHYDGGF